MFEENILNNTFRSEGFLLFFSILCFLFSSPSNQSVSLHAKGSSVTRNSFSLKKEEFHDHFKQFLVKTIERLTFTANGKHEYVPWTKFSLYFSLTVHYFITNISSFTPVLSKRIVLGCIYLPSFHFKNFSTSIWRLPFAVNVTLNLFNYKSKTRGLQEPWRGTMSLKITCEIRIAREGKGRRPAGSRNPSFLPPRTAAIRYNNGL